MTEYWKSLPKKYCDLCKCWFQDNKASIDFHERGTRHKEAVRERIKEATKKGKTDTGAKSAVQTDLEKIEAAAMAAYAKDLSTNPSMAWKYGSASSRSTVLGSASKTGTPAAAASTSVPSDMTLKKLDLGQERVLNAVTTIQKKKAKEAASKKWKEAKSEDGYSYFYNSETSESRWDAPPEGYLSVAEQLEEKGAIQEGETVPALRTKPLPRSLDAPEALGGWHTVRNNEEQPSVYLKPTARSAASELNQHVHNVAAEQAYEEITKTEFKTKSVGSLQNDEGVSCTFKKRKVGEDTKKQVRRRQD